MTAQQNYDDETNTDGSAARRPEDMKYLPGRASIKDDLQAIFEMEKQIGSAVFKLHQLVNQVQSSVKSGVTSKEYQDGLEEVTDTMMENNAGFKAQLEDIRSVTDLLSDHLTRVDADWGRIQKAANVTLKSHGVDPATLAEESDALKSISFAT